MDKLESKSGLNEKLETHNQVLDRLCFIDESGKLTRPIVSQSGSFEEELDERIKYEPNYSKIAELPEMYFLKDVAKQGEEAVYPFHGESNDIIYAIGRFFPERKFAAAIECFAGAGHVGIKLRNSGALQPNAPINAFEINPRAIALAKANSELNDSDIHYHQKDIIRNGFENLQANARKPGETIYFGNAPFALSTPKRDLEVCRDGGSDGLEKTLAFIEAALTDGSPKDVVVGVAYSRIGKSGNYEFEDRLKNLQQKGHEFTYKIELVQGAKLWRGYNDKKEQNNPMDLNNMVAKGEPGSNRYKEYESMAAAYKEEGWDKLAYIRYAIEIVNHTSEQSMVVRDKIGSILK